MNSICAIIPTFNRHSMLVECIKSVLAQSRLPDEIVVVDDGSTDDTLNSLAIFGSKIRIITKKNEGKSIAINTALASTTADFIWIVDDDDYAHPDGLLHLEAALVMAPASGFVFGRFEKFTDVDGARTFFPPSFWAHPDETNWTAAFLESMFSFQPAMLVRRSAYQAAGYFDPKYLRSQDYEMTLRLLTHFDCDYVPEVIFYQREHLGTRGPAGDRFDVAQNASKWLKYDQLIFKAIWQTFPLSKMTPSLAEDLPDTFRTRATFLFRACLMAKRGLWDSALADLETASQLDQGPLTEQETQLAERIVEPELSWDLLSTDPDLKIRLRKFMTKNAFAKTAVTALMRPVLWQFRDMVKSKRLQEGASRFKLLFEILGPVGILMRIGRSLSNRQFNRSVVRLEADA